MTLPPDYFDTGTNDWRSNMLPPDQLAFLLLLFYITTRLTRLPLIISTQEALMGSQARYHQTSLPLLFQQDLTTSYQSNQSLAVQDASTRLTSICPTFFNLGTRLITLPDFLLIIWTQET